MATKRTSAFLTVIILLAFSVSSVLSTEVLAQRELAPEWTYEDGSLFARVAVSADGSYVGAGTNDTGRFYLFQNGSLLWSYTVGTVHSISMSSDGKYIAVGAGSDFYLFDRENSRSPLLRYPVDYETSVVAVSSDGRYVAVGAMPDVSQQNAESRLYVFERGQSQPSWTKRLPGVLESLSMSGSGNYIVASTSLPGVMYVFAREQETPLWSYGFGERSGGVKISDNGEYVVATGGNQSDDRSMRIFMFHRQNSTPRYIKMIPEIPSSQGLSVSSNGSVFVISYRSRKELVLFDMNVRPYSARSIRSVSLLARGVSMAMSSDGRYIFVGSSSGMFVYEYLNNEGGLKWQYTSGNFAVYDIACSSDGRYVVAVGNGSEGYRVYFFEIESVVYPRGQSWSVIVGITMVVVVAGSAGFLLYRRSKKIDGKNGKDSGSSV